MGKRINIPADQYLLGLDTVIRNIQAAVDRMQTGSATGLADALLYVATESQQRCPVNIGDLRGSVQVTLDDQPIAQGQQGGGITTTGATPPTATRGEVSYNTPYAAVQHEQINYSHPHGGQAKYLESVLVEDGTRILTLIAGGTIEAMGGV